MTVTDSHALPKIVPLAFDDELLATLDLPGAPLEVLRGIGSGLTRSPDGQIWAVGDRGPNLKVELAVERYGLDRLRRDEGSDGAKVMPCPEIGPAISELRVTEDHVEIIRTLPLAGEDGRPLSGLPVPGGPHCSTEPAIDLEGRLIPADPSGVDSEGIVALADGSFWIGDEYGPSLLRVGPDGKVLERWAPMGSEASFAGSRYPVRCVLPALAAKRRLNRGFEALGVSRDERFLYLAFQSPLAHPDEAAHRHGTLIRLWKLDARTGALLAQYLYPLDPPQAFRRDSAKGKVDRSDVKVSELTVIGDDRLLVLERVSASTKLHVVELDERLVLDRAHMDPATRPTVEQLSRGPHDLPVLAKQCVLDTDRHPEIGADLEGVTLLSPRSLLLVNDNDFGIEGVRTLFWHIEFADDL